MIGNSDDRNKCAALFETYTGELCTGEPEIRFLSLCGHYAEDGNGKTQWIETHRDEVSWTSLARERSAVPLMAKPAGSMLEVAWRNAEGWNYVTKFRSLLDVRVSLSLSCADSETSNKLAADFESFKQEYKKDDMQECWASVDVKTTLGPASQFDGSRTLALSGVPCFLGSRYYSAFRICGLGWLYRLWYSTLNGVVEMHLHRELSIRGFGDEANRTQETDRTAESRAGRQLGPDGLPGELFAL